MTTEADSKQFVERSLRDQFLSQEYSDATILSSDGFEFPVHKVIICTHSPVLRAAFSPTWNANERPVRMEGDSRVVFAFFCFLYTGECRLPVESPPYAHGTPSKGYMPAEDLVNLYMIGDFYKVKTLVRTVLTYLLRQIQFRSTAADVIPALTRIYGLKGVAADRAWNTCMDGISAGGLVLEVIKECVRRFESDLAMYAGLQKRILGIDGTEEESKAKRVKVEENLELEAEVGDDNDDAVNSDMSG